MKLLQPTLAAAALWGAGAAHAEEAPAPNADRRAVQLAVQRDARHNQSATAALSLPVGRSAWVQAGLGQSRSRDPADGSRYRPRQASLGGGVAGLGWQATLVASQRRDGAALRQTDWAAAADWQPTAGVNLGLDAVRREARSRGLARSAGGPATPVAQQLRGHGLGLHAAVELTPRVSVYGATLHNRYTTRTQAATSAGGLLAGVPLLQGRVSAVNREEAAADRSQQLGATWRVAERVALNGEVLRDRLHDGGTLRSVQLKAAVDAGAGWTLTPGLGRSRGPQGEATTYGLLGARYGW